MFFSSAIFFWKEKSKTLVYQRPVTSILEHGRILSFSEKKLIWVSQIWELIFSELIFLSQTNLSQIEFESRASLSRSQLSWACFFLKWLDEECLIQRLGDLLRPPPSSTRDTWVVSEQHDNVGHLLVVIIRVSRISLLSTRVQVWCAVCLGYLPFFARSRCTIPCLHRHWAPPSCMPHFLASYLMIDWRAT